MTFNDNARGSTCLIFNTDRISDRCRDDFIPPILQIFIIIQSSREHLCSCSPSIGMQPFGREERSDIIGPGQPPTSRLRSIVIFAS
jgi:hypothetical protein